MRAACVAVVLAVAGLLTVSCNGLVDPSNNVTETFSGSVSPQGYDFHLFSVSKNGEITIKVTGLAPIDNQPIGLIWAQSSGAACDGQVLQSAAASLNQPSPIVGQIVNAIRNGFTDSLAGKVMVAHRKRVAPPGPTRILEAPNQLLLFRIDATDGGGGLLKGAALLVTVAKLALPIRIVRAGDRLAGGWKDRFWRGLHAGEQREREPDRPPAIERFSGRQLQSGRGHRRRGAGDCDSG